MNILMVLTSHDQLGDTGKKTGFWLEEFAAPYYVFVDAKVTVTLASPKGGRPSLIVLDEPNSNLDEAGELALVQAINALKAAGSTVVLITHRPNVLAVVDHILVLKDGAQQAFGPRDRVLKALMPGPRPAAVREAGEDA